MTIWYQRILDTSIRGSGKWTWTTDLRLIILAFDAEARDGAKYKKKYDKGETPYRRVLASKNIPDYIKAALKQKHEGLNPLLLQREIDRLISGTMRVQRDYEKTNLSK